MIIALPLTLLVVVVAKLLAIVVKTVWDWHFFPTVTPAIGKARQDIAIARLAVERAKRREDFTRKYGKAMMDAAGAAVKGKCRQALKARQARHPY
jgi:gamma-glutamylcysteine synthetase